MLKLLWALIAMNVFNVIDGVCTLNAVNNYGATEINPVMDYLLNVGPFTFLAVKISIMLIITVFLYRNRIYYSRFIKYSVGFYTVFYGLLTIYHFVILGIVSTL
jgi:hypothetical protein